MNTAGWKNAWTDLLNDSEQSFTPALPKLLAVEVELVVGNPGAPEDELTLTVQDATGQSLAVVTQIVRSANCQRVTFFIPKGGIEVSPGQIYRLKLCGGATFGWKYVVAGTKRARPHLTEDRSWRRRGLLHLTLVEGWVHNTLRSTPATLAPRSVSPACLYRSVSRQRTVSCLDRQTARYGAEPVSPTSFALLQEQAYV